VTILTSQTDIQAMEDADLVAACRAGGPEAEMAWGEFVSRFGRLVYAAARRPGAFGC